MNAFVPFLIYEFFSSDKSSSSWAQLYSILIYLALVFMNKEHHLLDCSLYARHNWSLESHFLSTMYITVNTEKEYVFRHIHLLRMEHPSLLKKCLGVWTLCYCHFHIIIFYHWRTFRVVTMSCRQFSIVSFQEQGTGDNSRTLILWNKNAIYELKLRGRICQKVECLKAELFRFFLKRFRIFVIIPHAGFSIKIW